MTWTTPPAAPAPAAPGSDRLVEHLAHAADCYYRAFATAAAADHGLTLIQARLLTVLERPLSMRALAALLGCDASNVTGIVDRLESRGLLRREADPADRRIKTVVLTPDGEATVLRVRAEITTALPHLGQLDDSERRTLQDLLDRAFPTASG
ncbi:MULTISPECIES: MarR family winged helix-turn-helix transcriptional regulator [unclassified Streptomyces]|uniref:MarR family winged helix-turn-helix transcriptional regulator n=1 Tax=unclassified Streptomyces TaxID=2593676 RepID=UPI001BE6B268|nr:MULTISPECIES: MarR family transcriptional regulator [unclassified Streptomyces]MBT2408447.1 MarR family transcriptional regulator [Streptomyces sp. ISL-21]MBT2611909.1 MarR family transcriptional regulator [Streptomyces sp. ISL-87]